MLLELPFVLTIILGRYGGFFCSMHCDIFALRCTNELQLNHTVLAELYRLIYTSVSTMF